MVSKTKILWLSILSVVLVGTAKGQTVDQIELQGNKRTNEKYLLRFISQQEGEEYDSLKVEEDKRILRTLSSVLNVETEFDNKGLQTILTYKITERWTLLPVGNFGVADDNAWLGAGFMETNLLGRGMYLYGYLQYRTPFALHVILKDPYILDSKFGYEVQYKKAEAFERDEQLVHDQYNLSEISIAGKYEIAYEKDIFLGVAGKEEIIYKEEGRLDKKESIKAFFTIRLQRKDYRSFMIEGWQNQLHINMLSPLTSHNTSLNIHNEFKIYKIFNKQNITGRLFAGISTEQNNLYQPFIVDNYMNFRGSGYRYKKGNKIISFNLEYRYTVFENKYAGIQVLGFTDAGWLGYKTNGKYYAQEALLYAGPGFRLNIKQVHNAVLRIDYGVNLNKPNSNGWVIGWGQYF